MLTVEDLTLIDPLETHGLGTLLGKKLSGVSTDSRTIKPGQVFVALHGNSFDGHKFLRQAYARGAACAIVERRRTARDLDGKPHVAVADTTMALGNLAAVYRKKFDIPVIAVAGSNGKTTTKEMIAAVLRERFNVLSTEGNHNNHIGVPQTLLRLNRQHEVAVVEIGTNHFGELSYLCNILMPSHGLITNIGREHLEFFKNLAGVARAEGELFEALAFKGMGFVNIDDTYIARLSKSVRTKVTYGYKTRRAHIAARAATHDRCGCFSFSVRPYDRNEFRVRLSVPGRHSMQNALAAAAVGIGFDIPPSGIRRALGAFSAVGKRMEVREAGGVTILNDTYNANPDSVITALDTLRLMKCNGRKMVILGDMLEMGREIGREHERIGRAVRRYGFDCLLTFGKEARRIGEEARTKCGGHFAGKRDLSRAAEKLLAPGDIVLVKGSRGMKMEEVVAELTDRLAKRKT